MDFDFTAEEKKILGEVRAFIEREATPELFEEAHENERNFGGPLSREFYRKFAANGWLCPSWPEEYGGLGASDMVTYLIRDELLYWELPSWFIGAHWAGPIILREANQEMKDKYLLPIARAEIEFAAGYTEPGAGSDLSSLRMRAKDQGDHYLINGQKTFNTHTHMADYHWLAVRTDPEAPAHKGISLLVVDLTTPGITVRPLITMTGSRTNEVYYDDVKVAKDCLVGEPNLGFIYLMKALDFERMFPYGNYRRVFEQVLEYVKNTEIEGRPLGDDPLVRQKIGRMATDLEVVRLLYYQLPSILGQGKIPNYQSSMEKIFTTERVAQRLVKDAMKILGPQAQLELGAPEMPEAIKASYYYRWSRVESIYGGASEIQRNIMAQRGLGLPRA